MRRDVLVSVNGRRGHGSKAVRNIWVAEIGVGVAPGCLVDAALLWWESDVRGGVVVFVGVAGGGEAWGYDATVRGVLVDGNGVGRGEDDSVVVEERAVAVVQTINEREGDGGALEVARVADLFAELVEIVVLLHLEEGWVLVIGNGVAQPCLVLRRQDRVLRGDDLAGGREGDWEDGDGAVDSAGGWLVAVPEGERRWEGLRGHDRVAVALDLGQGEGCQEGGGEEEGVHLVLLLAKRVCEVV